MISLTKLYKVFSLRSLFQNLEGKFEYFDFSNNPSAGIIFYKKYMISDNFQKASIKVKNLIS